ncbi:MAG: SDR family NAD(P)-dependent oxidoreductase, partial [Acidimicrobiia bacterium]
MAVESATVLVTGDAGAIGAATAELFVETGWHVLGVDKADRSGSASTDTYTKMSADLTDEDATVESLQVLDELPPLTHVVAIAGGALETEPLTQDDPDLIDLDDFRASLELNLTSQFITLRSALPWLKVHHGDRSVTFTSSFNALSGLGMPAYSAAKAGLIGMMNALVGPLGANGIRVNTVAPGTIRTPRT